MIDSQWGDFGMRAGISRRALVGSAVAALAVQRVGVAQDALKDGTPEASPMATPAVELYPPLPEIRDIQSRPWSLEGVKFSIDGEVTHIRVAPEGMGWEVGDEKEYQDIYRTQMIIEYELPSNETDVLLVGYDDDPVGVYEGDTVTVGGELVGTETGTSNFLNTEYTWQLMIADYIEEV